MIYFHSLKYTIKMQRSSWRIYSIGLTNGIWILFLYFYIDVISLFLFPDWIIKDESLLASWFVKLFPSYSAYLSF
jgi:hypothetical protein